VLLDATTGRLVRRFCGRSDRRRWQLRLDLYQLAGSPGPDSEFNYALLDHGATVCRVNDPLCASCPVRKGCVEQGGLAPAPQLAVGEECRDAA
jgi:adenine-specific DNA glycosylase